MSFIDPGICFAFGCNAAEITLNIHDERGYAVGAQLFGQQLKGLRLTSSCSTCYQSVTVECREGKPDKTFLDWFALKDGCTEDDGFALEGISFC